MKQPPRSVFLNKYLNPYPNVNIVKLNGISKTYLNWELRNICSIDQDKIFDNFFFELIQQITLVENFIH